MTLYKIFHRSILILVLMYFYLQVTQYKMVITLQNNICFDQNMGFICSLIFHILFLLLIIFIATSALSQSIIVKILYTTIASFIFTLAFIVTTNRMQLDNQTIFHIIKIYHPIPIDVKRAYFQIQLTQQLKQYVIDVDTLNQLTKQLPSFLSEQRLENLNCEGINIATKNLIFDSYKESVSHYKTGINYITTASTIVIAIKIFILKYLSH